MGEVTAKGEVLQALTEEEVGSVRRELTAAYEQGIRACAIAFIHGYRYPEHEQQVANIAQAVGFSQVSTSHTGQSPREVGQP